MVQFSSGSTSNIVCMFECPIFVAILGHLVWILIVFYVYYRILHCLLVLSWVISSRFWVIPNILDLWLQIVRSRHDHSLAEHFGQTETLELVHWEFSWLGLWAFVTDYMNSCNIYLRNKLCYHKPYSLLKQLLVSLYPWDSISMDFIEQLPVSDGCLDILVVVNRLIK